MAYTPEESRSMAETIMQIQGAGGQGFQAGQAAGQKLSKEQFMMKRMQDLGMEATGGTAGGMNFAMPKPATEPTSEIGLFQKDPKLYGEYMKAKREADREISQSDDKGITARRRIQNIKDTNYQLNTTVKSLTDKYGDMPTLQAEIAENASMGKKSPIDDIKRRDYKDIVDSQKQLKINQELMNDLISQYGEETSQPQETIYNTGEIVTIRGTRYKVIEGGADPELEEVR